METDNTKLDIGIIKKLTGGDVLYARDFYTNPFKPMYHHLW